MKSSIPRIYSFPHNGPIFGRLSMIQVQTDTVGKEPLKPLQLTAREPQEACWLSGLLLDNRHVHLKLDQRS